MRERIHRMSSNLNGTWFTAILKNQVPYSFSFNAFRGEEMSALSLHPYRFKGKVMTCFIFVDKRALNIFDVKEMPA